MADIDLDLTAHEHAAHLRAGDYTSRALTEATLARIALRRMERDADTEELQRTVVASEAALESAALELGRLSGGRLIPHTNIRRAIAEHMANSMATAPHVTAIFEVDFSAIIADRAKKKAKGGADFATLTYTAYFVTACVRALQTVPVINSRWHADAVEVFDDINIGVGTALGDEGLVVPVIHKAQTLSLAGISRQLTDLTNRARAGKLQRGDVSGGTFTISNHGVSGSLMASPIIINQPQSAILGIGKLEKRVVVREVDGHDTISIRPMAYVSLTIDHRVIDGHQTNTFLKKWVEVIEGWKDAN